MPSVVSATAEFWLLVTALTDSDGPPEPLLLGATLALGVEGELEPPPSTA